MGLGYRVYGIGFTREDGRAGSGRSRSDFATDEEWQVRRA